MLQPKETAVFFAPKHGNIDPSSSIKNPKFHFDEALQRKDDALASGRHEKVSRATKLKKIMKETRQ